MYMGPKKKKFFKAEEGKAPERDVRRPRNDSGARPSAPRSPIAETIKPDSVAAEEQTFSDDRLEGRNPVMEALRAGRTINKIWVAQKEAGRSDPALSRIINLARDKGIIVHEVPRISLDQMSETHGHQGIIAQTASHEYATVEDIISLAEAKGEPPFLVMLDALKDAYNLGSVLRIADAAGVHGVIIPKHRSIGLDSMVAKASAGAIEHVPVARVTNLSQTIASLKEQGFWVAGTDALAQVSYEKSDYTGKLLIIIGSEGEGMSKNIANKCDYLVSIPMSGNVNSLNAAVAAGIIIFEAARQRRKG